MFPGQPNLRIAITASTGDAGYGVESPASFGTVVAVGDAVTSWKVGDAVVGGPSVRCGECEYCRAGRPNLCVGRAAVGEGGDWQGAFADYMRVPQGELLRLPDGVTLREAAGWSLLWLALAAGFAAVLYFYLAGSAGPARGTVAAKAAAGSSTR